jgi:N-acetylneuraminic acid mutarotase
LSQDTTTGILRVTNEIIYLDLKTSKWQKPATVFADKSTDVPAERMGSQMVHYKDKLYIYSGGDLYLSGDIFADVFSFNMGNGNWRREDAYLELNKGDGVILGAAARIYNTDAVVWTGGCNQYTKQCLFSTAKETLFEQPQV